MNGFAGAILSLLLGWLRAFFNHFWRILNSEDGGALVSFLSLHWKAVFLGLCVAGFVVDRIIFFFRWRPDYVWSTKLGRLRRKGRQEADPEEEAAFRPIPQNIAPESDAPAAYQRPFEPPEMDFAPGQATQSYAPAQTDFAPMVQPSAYAYAPAAPIMDFQPVFDEPTESWAPVHPYEQPYDSPAQGMEPSFGMERPDPAAYLQDVQAGFAPPPTPEALYPQRTFAPMLEPVHPGLDVETFQQNIGLSEAPPPVAEPASALPSANFPDTTYVPFYQNTEVTAAQKSKGGLSSLAKRARELVRVSDDDGNQPTIRDLQSPVNIKTAFHPPVLPRRPEEGGEE